MEAWQTHEIANQVDERRDYNLLDTDAPLLEALQRAGAESFVPGLSRYSEELGRSFGLGEQANEHTPELQLFDKRGRRVDFIDFHPSWHALAAMYRRQGLVSLPFDNDRQGRWAAWAAGFYLQGQVEAGVLCPATMTQAAIPVLQKEPALWAQLQDKLVSTDYDERDVPIAQKRSILIGMGMTEKQGGSDVRANTTTATPVGEAGRGNEYRIRGHKWFFSAPMCDAHLVVAKTGDGSPGCFFVPRWRPDGTKNAVHIQRLKNKLGNRSNSSSEVEFHDAYGVLLGEPGRGIPTIIEMATYTRLNCVVGSAGILRQALVQALSYARGRRAFGHLLVEQPLMRAVLADLALENEGNVALMMRLCEGYENQHEPTQRAWMRIMTPAAKFWVCKRAVELTGEAMEVLGGNGYIDDGIMARLFREAPVNSIWEGSGNVMCLDVMRAIGREPEGFFAILDELARDAAGEPRLVAEVQALRELVTTTPPAELEALGRRLAERLVLAAMAVLLHRDAPPAVAQAFVATRLDARWGRVAGGIDTRGLDVEALLQRAFPA